jgi:hypothetical protein
MKVLLDTNIIIHRETHRIIRDDIGILFRWLDNLHYDKLIHPNTIREIEKYKDQDVVNTFKIKLGSYNVIASIPALDSKVVEISKKIDVTENDLIDTEILNIQYLGISDIFITEDRKIRKKAYYLGISSKVFSIEEFLEKVSSEHPELIDYKVLSVKKERFGNVDLSNSFFDSFRTDYIGFDKWYRSKNDEYVYVCKHDKDVFAFLFLKIESNDESYSNITPQLSPKKRLKIGTFKVILNGYKLGERFLKIIFDNAIEQNVDEIYVTIFNKSLEQQRLIYLLERYGFKYFGIKTTNSGEENVYVREMSKKTNSKYPKQNYPYIKRNARTFLVPIYGKYHTELFPDSILRTESPLDFIENEPWRNAISKVYISRSITRDIIPGDNLVFYRTGGYYESVITTIGIVENITTNIPSYQEFKDCCGKRSVFTEKELLEQWEYKPYSRPFVVQFLYSYSFPHRINLKKLIELGIVKDISSAPRGFQLISSSDFDSIIKETQTDARIIVD